MPKQTISTFNGVTQTAGPAYSLVIATSAVPSVISFRGFVNGNATPGAAQYFIQFFNAASAPANASVPLASFMVTSTNGFAFAAADIGVTGLSSQNLTNLIASTGLVACLSTTEATLTLATGGITMDLSVDIDSSVIPVVGAQKVGPTTAFNFTVWTVAQGAAGTYSKLISLKVQELLNAPHYIYIFTDIVGLAGATSVPANNMGPYLLAPLATVNLSFSSGITPVGMNNAYQEKKGCFVLITENLLTWDNSTIPPTLSAPTSVSNVASITAFYI